MRRVADAEGSEVAAVDEAGHWSMVDQPDAVYTSIERYLDGPVEPLRRFPELPAPEV